MPLLKQFLCLLRHREHEYIRVYEGNRIYEVCLCGARTQGWEIEVKLTPRDYANIHDDMTAIEHSLHGGG